MAKWVYVVGTNCKDAAKAKEFNHWYDTIHLPDVVATPGFISAERFEVKDPAPGKPKFIALYNIETDDIDKTMAGLGEAMKKVRSAGRMTDLLEIVDRALCKQTSALKK